MTAAPRVPRRSQTPPSPLPLRAPVLRARSRAKRPGPALRPRPRRGTRAVSAERPPHAREEPVLALPADVLLGEGLAEAAQHVLLLCVQAVGHDHVEDHAL